MVFPRVMYGCESWTLKKVEHWITDAFELWCWRRLLRVPWTERRSNQLILKEINHEYSLEGLMLKFHQCEEPTHWKNPDAGKDWGPEEKGVTENEMVEWHHWLNGFEFDRALGDDEGQGGLACCSSWGCKESDMTEWLNWTELNLLFPWIASLHPCRNPRRSLFYRQENWVPKMCDLLKVI